VLGIVIEHADELGRPEVADLYTRRAYSLYVVNRFRAALACAESAVRAAETCGDAILLADALVVLARVAMFARGPLGARRAAQRAVEILELLGDEIRLAAALTELARAHSNLPTVGIVAEPGESAAAFAERAVDIGQRHGRDDIVAQALCYLGDARSRPGRCERRGGSAARHLPVRFGQPRGRRGCSSYVNAAGGAYRSGRLDEAEKYVAAGLRAAVDGEFSAGQYRLRLTGAAVRASRGDWDGAISQLRALVSSPGEPGVMARWPAAYSSSRALDQEL